MKRAVIILLASAWTSLTAQSLAQTNAPSALFTPLNSSLTLRPVSGLPAPTVKIAPGLEPKEESADVPEKSGELPLPLAGTRRVDPFEMPIAKKELEPDGVALSVGVASSELDLTSLTDIEAKFERYEWMNDRSIVGEPLNQVEVGGAYGWFVKKFEPVEVRFGKVRFGGGIIAAIKKRDPFCLMNPLIFGASW